MKPLSIEKARQRIASCREYLTLHAVFLLDDKTRPDELIVFPIYYQDGDWQRYFRRWRAFVDVEEMAPHLCVGVYDRGLRHWSLEEFEFDVWLANASRDEWQLLADPERFSDVRPMTAMQIWKARKGNYMRAADSWKPPQKKDISQWHHGVASNQDVVSGFSSDCHVPSAFQERRRGRPRKIRPICDNRGRKNLNNHLPHPLSHHKSLTQYRKELREQAARAHQWQFQSGQMNRPAFTGI